MANKLVHLQLAIILQHPKDRVKLTHSFFADAVKHWANTGESPERMEIRIIEWKHGKKTARQAGSDKASQDEARLRFRGVLQAARNLAVSIR